MYGPAIKALARPVACVVGDIFHHVQVYVAARDDHGDDRALAITADGARHNLGTLTVTPIQESLITNYLMRPADRFAALARQEHLLRALSQPGADGKSRGRIGVDFGSVGLCHVAAGFTDAMVEFAKGFAVWDLAPGQYILHAAGGAVLDLDGNPLPLEQRFASLDDIATAMNGRQKFVAAGSHQLAHEILHALR